MSRNGSCWGVVASSALLAASVVQAEPLNWNYLEGVYYHDIELDFPAAAGAGELEGDGVGLTGSMAVAPNVLLQMGNANGDIDLPGFGQIPLDRTWIGPGLYADFDLGGVRVGPWARIAYERMSVFTGGVAEGWHGAAGLRLGFGERFELALTGEVGDYEPARFGSGPRPDLDREVVRADLLYAVTPRWSLLGGFESGDFDPGFGYGDIETERFYAGARWYLDATPGGAYAAEGEPAHSGRANYNYMQAVYRDGDELEAFGGEIDVHDGTVLSGAVRLSERFVMLGEVTAMNAQGGGESALDFQSLGPAIRFGDTIAGGTWLDIYAGVSYERVSLPLVGVFTGGGASIGARWLAGDFEVAPRVMTLDTDGTAGLDLDGQRYRLEVLYSLSPSVALVADLERIELDAEGAGGGTSIEADSYGLGIRYYYAGKR